MDTWGVGPRWEKNPLMPPVSLFIATPAYGGIVNTSYHRSVMALRALCDERGIGFEGSIIDGCSMITHARNWLTTLFLRTTAHSHMLFIDADMGFLADDVLSMLDYPDHEVSAVLCPKREYNWTIIRDTVRQTPDIDPAVLANLGGQYTGMFNLPPGVNAMTVGRGPIEVASAGTGIMLVARTFLERVVEEGGVETYDFPGLDQPFLEFFRAGVFDGGLQGEDVWFCNLARKHGATIHGFPGFAITHSGMHSFIGDLPGIVAHYDGPVQTPSTPIKS